MEVDGHVKLLCPRKERLERSVIEVSALRGTADESTLEAKLLDRSFQLVRRSVRIGQGKMCKPCIPMRMRSNAACDAVVYLLSPAKTFSGRKQIRTRTRNEST